MKGILLAGGFSRRMGKPKALLPYKQTTLIEWLTGQLQPVCDSITIVTNDELYNDMILIFNRNTNKSNKFNESKFLSQASTPFASRITVITDVPKFKGFGPIAGIYSGMNNDDPKQDDHLYTVVACDMPYVNINLIKRMANVAEQSPELDVVMVHKQPLHAIYRHRILPYAKMCLETKQLRLQQLLQSLCVYEIQPENLSEEDVRSFININTPEEYKSIQDDV